MDVIAEFLAGFARDRAEQVVDTPGGFAVLSPRRFPHAHDHNCLYVLAPVDPDALVAAADAVSAAMTHRRIDHVAGPTAEPVAVALRDAGYEREGLVRMTLVRAPDPDRPAPEGVVELSLPQRVDFADRVWTGDFAEKDAAISRELAERARSAGTAAQCTFLAVVGPDGVEASCDLFVRGDVAQIEEVSTLQPFRGRGHASRLVRAAAERAGVGTVFLLAEVDDWPKELYGRLGFEVTGAHDVWSRVP